MQNAIFNYLSSLLAPALPENVQVLKLYDRTERETDLVKIGVLPAAVHSIGTPFRTFEITLAAGVRRRLPDAESRLSEIFNKILSVIGSGLKPSVSISGGTLDAILPGLESPATGMDDSSEYLVSSITIKAFCTKTT